MTSTTALIRCAGSAQSTFASPLGRLRLLRTERGLAGAWFDGQRHHPGLLEAPERPDDPLLRDAAARLAAYFDGDAPALDIPLDLIGSPFQRAVWQALLRIPRGSTSSYGAVARELGSAAAVRAVGGAIGRNPVSVIVPCHRVVGSAGAMTGYAGGIDRKLALLKIEGVRLEGARLGAVAGLELAFEAR